MPLSGSLPTPSAAEVELGRSVDTLVRLLTGHWAAQTVRTLADLRIVDHVTAGADPWALGGLGDAAGGRAGRAESGGVGRRQ